VFRPGHLEVFAAAGHHARPEPELLDRCGLIGGRAFGARQGLQQQPGAEHLRRLREPELRAVLGGLDFFLRNLFHRVRDRQSQDAADFIAFDLAHQLVQVLFRQAGPRGVVHQQPVVRLDVVHRGDETVVHRIAPRFAAAVKRLQPLAERAPVVRGEGLVLRRQHHKYALHPGHANCSHRMPKHRLAGERQVLLRCPGRKSRTAAGGGNQRIERHRSSFNSGRYNYSQPLLMHRDSLPARRRYTRLAGSADALALARLAQEDGRPLALISATALDAQRLVDEIQWFSPGLRVCLLPDWETLPYDQFSPHQDLVSERLATLYRIQRAEFDIAVVPASTALVRLCPPAYLAGRTFFLKAGERLSLEKFREQLAIAGYQHATQVVSPGEVCFRGGLIDLYPMGSALPYRLDLDDDVVDSIKTFDVDTQRTVYAVKEIRMLPAREFPLD